MFSGDGRVNWKVSRNAPGCILPLSLLTVLYIEFGSYTHVD